MSPKTTTASGAGSVAIGGNASGNTITTNVTVVRSGGPPPGSPNMPTDDEPFPAIDPSVDIALRIRVRSGSWLFDARIDADAVTTETVSIPAEGKRRLLPQGRPPSERFLKGVGNDVADLLPATLRGRLETRLLAAGSTPTVLVLSDEQDVPWELAWFGPETNGGHLCERAIVGRWMIDDRLPPCPPGEIPITGWNVLAQSNYGSGKAMPEATEERDFLCNTVAAAPIDPTRKAVEQWLRGTDRRRALHVALHGWSDPVEGHHGLRLGETEWLSPQEMTDAGWRLGAPPRIAFAFLNACEVGTADRVYGLPSGFPGTLLRSGAGAVVGPLWPVESPGALDLAKKVYGHIAKGRTIGDALHKQRDNRGDAIAPLGYVLWGHPLVRVTRSGDSVTSPGTTGVHSRDGAARDTSYRNDFEQNSIFTNDFSYADLDEFNIADIYMGISQIKIDKEKRSILGSVILSAFFKGKMKFTDSTKKETAYFEIRFCKIKVSSDNSFDIDIENIENMTKNYKLNYLSKDKSGKETLQFECKGTGAFFKGSLFGDKSNFAEHVEIGKHNRSADTTPHMVIELKMEPFAIGHRTKDKEISYSRTKQAMARVIMDKYRDIFDIKKEIFNEQQ